MGTSAADAAIFRSRSSFWPVIVVSLLPITAAMWPAATAGNTADAGITIIPPHLAAHALTSLQVVVGTVLIALLIGVPAGMAVRSRRLSLPALLLAVAALGIPQVLHGAAWLSLLSREASLNSVPVCALIQGLALSPVAALVFGAAAARVDPDLEAVARLELSGWRLLLVHLRHLYGGAILVTAVLSGILAASSIAISDLLLVRTLAEETFSRFQVDGYAATVRFVLPLPLLAAALCWRFCPITPGAGRDSFEKSTGGRRTWWLLAGLLPLLLVAALPLVCLLRQAGGPAAAFRHWGEFGGELRLSVLTSAVASLIGLALAWPVAWCAARSCGVMRRTTAAWLAFQLLTPGCFIGMGLIHLCARPGLFWLYDSPGILIAAQILRVLPLQVLVLLPFAAAIPLSWLEEGALHGSGRRADRLILFRPLIPAVTAAGAVGFILAIQELDASVLVAPPGTPPLMVRFFTLLHYGLYPDVAAMGLLLAALAIPIAAIALLLARQKRT